MKDEFITYRRQKWDRNNVVSKQLNKHSKSTFILTYSILLNNQTNIINEIL